MQAPVLITGAKVCVVFIIVMSYPGQVYNVVKDNPQVQGTYRPPQQQTYAPPQPRAASSYPPPHAPATTINYRSLPYPSGTPPTTDYRTVQYATNLANAGYFQTPPRPPISTQTYAPMVGHSTTYQHSPSAPGRRKVFPASAKLI
jgi:hypothetical protein